MKKLIPVLMIICLLCSFAACGKQSEEVAIVTPAPIAEAETAEDTSEAGEAIQIQVPEKTETAENAEGEAQAERGETAAQSTDTGNNGNTDTGDTGNTNTDDNGNSGDLKSIAQGYVGSSLSELESAIGAPNSSEYVISCQENGGQEGLLYYDGFMVWTMQYADGTETILGVD